MHSIYLIKDIICYDNKIKKIIIVFCPGNISFTKCNYNILIIQVKYNIVFSFLLNIFYFTILNKCGYIILNIL